MCKHLAAVLYGIGARLDRRPEALFRLRQVDHQQLIAGVAEAAQGMAGGRKKTLAAAELGDVFGIELDDVPTTVAPAKRAAISAGRARLQHRAGKPTPAKGKVKEPPASTPLGDVQVGPAAKASPRPKPRPAAANKPNGKVKPVRASAQGRGQNLAPQPAEPTRSPRTPKPRQSLAAPSK